MKKLFKSTLSLALALVLMLSLGVAAFADDSAKSDNKEKEPETIQIYFNLATMEPCALRMRNLGYDDIRLNGISYRADAEDGVISIELADLAAAKLLTEYKDEAEEAGIDFDKIYIRGGKVLVKDDAGLSSTEIANMKAAISSFMSAKRIGVNIGDKFELSNGTEVKFKVRVCNFIYPQQPETKEKIDIKTITAEDMAKNADKFLNMSELGLPKSAKTPEITTLFFYYDVVDSYTNESTSNPDRVATQSEGKAAASPTSNGSGYVGIAKAKDDSNTYFIQINYASDNKNTSEPTTAKFEEMNDLTSTETPEDKTEEGKVKKGFWSSLFEFFKRDENGNITEVANNIKISTDKEGKNVVRDIDIKNKTPDSLDKIKKEAAKEDGEYTGVTYDHDNDKNNDDVTKYVPDDTSKVTKDDGTKAEIEVENSATEACADGNHDWFDDYEPNVNEVPKTEYVDRHSHCKKCGIAKVDKVQGEMDVNGENKEEQTGEISPDTQKMGDGSNNVALFSMRPVDTTPTPTQESTPTPTPESTPTPTPTLESTPTPTAGDNQNPTPTADGSENEVA